jgi:hypothetical protein
MDVSCSLLQALAEQPEEHLQQSLVHLQAAEFLYETRLFPEPAYTFKHALTQEVVYNSLLLERRRGLHACLVEALEALASNHGAEQVEHLAHHALRGEVWDTAVTYYQQAGATGRRRCASPRLKAVGIHRSLPTAASATSTSPKGTWRTPSGCWSRAWPSVVRPASGAGFQ